MSSAFVAYVIWTFAAKFFFNVFATFAEMK